MLQKLCGCELCCRPGSGRAGQGDGKEDPEVRLGAVDVARTRDVSPSRAGWMPSTGWPASHEGSDGIVRTPGGRPDESDLSVKSEAV